MKLAARGANLGRAPQHFVEVLDAFGPVALEQAIREALAKEQIQAPDVRLILERHRRESGGTPRTRVDLPDDARVRDLVVPAQDLGSYDQLIDRGQEVDDVATS